MDLMVFYISSLFSCSLQSDGSKDIVAFRKSIWTAVSSRKHVVTKIFFGEDNDMMLHGTVTYVMKHDPQGKDVKIDWAARAEFEDGQDGSKMKYYQVYLVCFLPLSLLALKLFVSC